MIGAFLIRGLVMVFGYAYPAYECYKVVDKNRLDIEQLRFWCQYLILIAMLTIFERVADTFVSWVPMYGEAKLFFIIYLWYPKTKGTTFVYDSFFRPYIAKHEVDIDRNLLELRTRAGDFAVLHWQKAANYGRTRVVDILQYVASQSTPKPRSTQLPQQGTGVRQSTAAVSTAPPPTKEKRSIASSIEFQEELKEDISHSEVSTAAPYAAALNAQKSTGTQVTQPLAGSSKTTTSHGEAMPTESAYFSAHEDKNLPPQDKLMEDAIRVTRGRLRRIGAALNH